MSKNQESCRFSGGSVNEYVDDCIATSVLYTMALEGRTVDAVHRSYVSSQLTVIAKFHLSTLPPWIVEYMYDHRHDNKDYTETWSDALLATVIEDCEGVRFPVGDVTYIIRDGEFTKEED